MTTATHDPHELKLLFSLFDTDHDGRITEDEIKRLVETVSGQLWTEEKLAAFMQIVDTDTSGDITLDEFTVMMNQFVPTSTLGLRDLFDRFDVNGDGSVGKEEFEQVMKENGMEFNQDQTEIFKRKFAEDENKQVTYEDFVEAAKELYQNIKFN